MIGDAKRIYRLARGYWLNGVENTYVGKKFIQRDETNVIQVPEQQRNDPNRTLTGIRAWFRRGHYNEVKHCTRQWKAFVAPFLADRSFDVVYCHFLFTYPLLAKELLDRVFVIDTHNSEWGWYRSFKESSRNPLIRQVCDFSARRASQILRMLPTTTIMAHVCQADLEAYRAKRPDLTHLVVPNGGDFELRKNIPDYEATKKKILFFGSLHGKMSLDAIRHFSTDFWPVLKDIVEPVIAGANPSATIRSLASKNGWELRADLTEEQVDRIFEESHYAIMPFTYGEGSKLKFFDACSRGVPVLSTTAGACGQQNMPSFVCVSDSPQEWHRQILLRTQMEEDWKEQVELFGREFTWKVIAARTLPTLCERIGAARNAL